MRVVLVEATVGTRRRADARGAPRGARRASAGPTSAAQRHVALALHGHDEAGGRLPRADACCSRATPRTCTSPSGGQGLNLGVQDAVNLGWKLAQVVRGDVARRAARHLPGRAAPGRARGCCAHDGADRRSRAADDRLDALREVIGELSTLDEARKRMAGLMSGLDIRYDLGDGHPLVGRRMPDLDLETADGVVRMSASAARGDTRARRPDRDGTARRVGRPGPAGERIDTTGRGTSR